MAVEPEETEALQGDETGKKKRIIIIAAGAGLLLLVVLIALYITLFTGSDDSIASTSEQRQVATDNVDEAYYVAMPRDLIFNVPGAQRDRMAQIGVQLMVRGPRNEVLAQENIPLLESTLLDVFSRATAERLNTPEGKRELRLQALDAVRRTMEKVTDGSPVVEEVLFTGFVLQ